MPRSITGRWAIAISDTLAIFFSILDLCAEQNCEQPLRPAKLRAAVRS
jgi:hypothetical protein